MKWLNWPSWSGRVSACVTDWDQNDGQAYKNKTQKQKLFFFPWTSHQTGKAPKKLPLSARYFYLQSFLCPSGCHTCNVNTQMMVWLYLHTNSHYLCEVMGGCGLRQCQHRDTTLPTLWRPKCFQVSQAGTMCTTNSNCCKGFRVKTLLRLVNQWSLKRDKHRRSSPWAANPNLISSSKDTDMSHNRAKYTHRIGHSPVETGITVSEEGRAIAE